MNKELQKLIEAHDKKCAEMKAKHGFVGAFAAQEFIALNNWLWSNRREIAEKLP